MNTKIFTDGSSLGNPGPGGFCAIIEKDGETYIAKGNEDYTTNNRMEMSAIIAGLYWLRKNYPKESTCAVYSDSSLLIDTMNKGWKRKKNLDLWKKLDSATNAFDKISWNWIKGHANHLQNTKADKIAVAEALKAKKNAGAQKKHPTSKPEESKSPTVQNGLFDSENF
ncbi:ribonuclease HI [Candidatus Peregrinibacteria bacterium]|nr:ribonuclease HI [Candidatus Peregrinibacteria bacterium]